MLRRLRSLWTSPKAGRGAAPDEPPPADGGVDPMLEFVARDAPVVRRLDPPGLLAGASVLGATQWFWQYHCANILLFARGQEHSVLAPLIPGDALPRQRRALLDRLVGTAWAPSPAALATPLFIRYQQAHADRAASRVDLAPLLHGGLRRLAGDRDPSALADTLGFLDVLATFRGHGSKELERPWVELGEPAIERIVDELKRRRQDRPREEGVTAWVDPELREGLPGPLRERLLGRADAGDANAGTWRTTALIDRTLPVDHAVGGYHAEAALVTLKVHRGGWSYARRVLWCEDDPGIEKS